MKKAKTKTYSDKIIIEIEPLWEKEKQKKFEELAKIIYEATRLEAKWSQRKIVPEKWERRDKNFRKQFIEQIDRYLSLKKLPTPKQAHNEWVKAYQKMGWKYGKKRDPVKKTHPDLVPYDQLPQCEKDKDAIFLMAVWLVRKIIKDRKRLKNKNL